MNLDSIIEDAMHYPLKDYKKILILGLPYLIIGILTIILGVQLIMATLYLDDLNTLSNYLTSSEFITTLGQTSSIILLSLIINLFIRGISLDIIRKTIQEKDIMPSFKVKQNLIDGLKVYILAGIYLAIPTSIYVLLLIASLNALKSNSFILITLLSILYIICLIMLFMLYIVAKGKLAETDSLKNALKLKEIYHIAGKIGYIKILAVLCIITVFAFVLGIIGSFVEMFPVIGLLIVIYLFSSYMLIFSSRAFGLLYLESKDTLKTNTNQNISDNSLKDSKNTTPIGKTKNA